MVIAAAGIAAAGTVAASSIASNATENAANTAANAQNNTLAMQQQQLQSQIALQQQALNQQTQLSAPYRSFGESAIPQLSGMLGLSPQPTASSAVPLNGAPAGSGTPQQAPYQAPGASGGGMGPMGGAGLPVGGQYSSSGVLSAANLGVPGAMTQGATPGMPGQPGQPGQPGANVQPGQSMYTPPSATLNGVPSYANVLGQYQNLMGNIYTAEGLNSNGTMGANGPNTTAMTNALRNSPGYQFQLQEGNQNAVNQASAMGMGMSGNTLQSLNEVGQGLADSTYQQYLGNLGNTLGQYQGYVGDYQNYLGNLMNSLGMGQAAAAGQAANIGQSASNMGAAYQNAGAQSAAANNQLGNIAMTNGANQASIGANEIAGLTKAAGIAGNGSTMNNTLNALNNPNGQSLYGGASSGWSSSPSDYGYAMPVDYGGGFPG